MSSYALDQQPLPTLAPGGVTTVPGAQQLSRNPMLPQHPLGAFTDSQYEASDAVLRNQIAKQYADLLQQLGYRDEAGHFIQGSVETEANKTASELARSQHLAAEGVTQNAQREGTLFSGVRGTLQARAEDPFVRGRADLLSQTPLTLQKLYEQAAGLSGDFVLQQNQLLADAAARRAQALTENPPGGGASGATDGTSGATEGTATTSAGEGTGGLNASMLPGSGAVAPVQAPSIANSGLPTGGGVIGPSPFMAPLAPSAAPAPPPIMPQSTPEGGVIGPSPFMASPVPTAPTENLAINPLNLIKARAGLNSFTAF